jgi:hypothetical protein
MKRSVVLRCVLATGVLAGVLAVSACGPASNGAKAPAGSASTAAPTGAGDPGQAGQPTPTSPSAQPPSPSAGVGSVSVGSAIAGSATVADIHFPLCASPGPHTQSPVEAATLDVSCDSQEIVAKADWSTWNTSYAAGTGISLENDCTPNCASGTQHSYPVTIRLDKPVQATCGEFWSEMVLTYQGTPPPGADYRSGKPQSITDLGSSRTYC